MNLTDRFERPLRDLRISVTDRCNFRCGYCMPPDREYNFLPRSQILSLEEIVTVAKVFARFGLKKLRITGGEPLLRKNLPWMIGELNKIPEIDDIALTTNGFYLPVAAPAFAKAGLPRITVSLDSLKLERFQEMTNSKTDPDRVIAGMDAAAAAGLKVKVNAVIQRGVNDDEIIDLVTLFREKGYILRFIEFMDVGNVNSWQAAGVVPSAEIRERIHAVYPCAPIDRNYPGEVAQRWRYLDGKGEFGLISSVTQPFCGACNRARLSADGHLYTCLFANQGHDLKTTLREQGEEALAEQLAAIWGKRKDRYSELRSQGINPGEKVEMFHIGG